MKRLVGSLALALMVGLWTVSDIEAEPRIEVTGGAPTFQEVALKFAPLQTSPVMPQPKQGDGTVILDLNPTDGDQGLRTLGSVKAGESVDIQVILNQEVTSAIGFIITLTFDPLKLVFVSAKGDGLLKEVFFISPSVIGNSVIFSGNLLLGSVTAKGSIAVVTFKASNSFSGNAETTLDNLTINTISGFRRFNPNVSVILSSNDLSAGKPPQISISDSSITFGDNKIGASSSKTFTISNAGGGTLSILGITVSGADSAQFKVSPTTATILAGRSLTVTAIFSPISAGTKSATLSITHNAGGTLATVSLTGSAVSPTISVSATSLSFGAVRIGESKALSFSVSNTGNSPLTISSITKVGTDSSQFSVTQASAGILNLIPRTISFTINPGAKDEAIGVTFAPTSTGEKTITLSIVHNAPGSPTTIRLNGAGTKPNLSYQPNILDFGNVAVNAGVERPITFYNSGNDTLKITSISGTFEKEFGFFTLQFSLSVAPRDSQTIAVTFVPLAPGNRTGFISANSNDPVMSG